jgi:hypothetical protein
MFIDFETALLFLRGDKGGIKGGRGEVTIKVYVRGELERK